MRLPPEILEAEQERLTASFGWTQAMASWRPPT